MIPASSTHLRFLQQKKQKGLAQPMMNSDQRNPKRRSATQAHLNREEELEFRRQLLLGVQAVGEVDSETRKPGKYLNETLNFGLGVRAVL
jgi:hypothetical protein